MKNQLVRRSNESLESNFELPSVSCYTLLQKRGRTYILRLYTNAKLAADLPGSNVARSNIFFNTGYKLTYKNYFTYAFRY